MNGVSETPSVGRLCHIYIYKNTVISFLLTIRVGIRVTVDPRKHASALVVINLVIKSQEYLLQLLLIAINNSQQIDTHLCIKMY